MSTNDKKLAWDEKGPMRPEGWMENPYIGKDGKDYHSFEALKRANEEWTRQMFELERFPTYKSREPIRLPIM